MEKNTCCVDLGGVRAEEEKIERLKILACLVSCKRGVGMFFSLVKGGIVHKSFRTCALEL